MWNLLKLKPQKPQTLGKIGEELAQLEYGRRGYKVIAANFFNRKGKQLGEVDFIAKNKEQVIFVEVKTRTEERGYHGTAVEAVDHFKQTKILKAVKIFLLKQPKYQSLQPQIDVCAIIIQKPLGQLRLVSINPSMYLVLGKLDKINRSVTIIPNAVEDWN